MRKAQVLLVACVLAMFSAPIALAGDGEPGVGAEEEEANDTMDEAVVENRESYNDAIDYVLGHPDEFGGMHFDDRGEFHVLAVDRESAVAEELGAMMPEGTSVSIDAAVRSLAEMHSVPTRSSTSSLPWTKPEHVSQL